MEFYGRNPSMEGYPTDPSLEWNSTVTETGLDESMWQLSLGRENGRDLYPERPGEADCVYYMRTGFCGYGARCRFNHPRDPNPGAGVVRFGGDYPERVGQPVCQYFLKTGTCKFGTTCKYHHPRYGGGSMSPVSVNIYGYPLRPGEKECSYYVKTGQCKFGIMCKFHHPQPAGTSMPAPAPAFYPTVPSPQYGGGIPSWQVARPPLLPGSYVQGPYGPLLVPHGVVPLPGWGTYPAPMTPVASPSTQQAVGTGSSYGVTQLSPSPPSFPGPFSPVSSLTGPSSSGMKESMFPERPGQPVCQFYMRTGDCKFGFSCRYHHPQDRNTPKTSYVLSPMGLPLRPGAPACTFYTQHSVCKFGPTCKFDHPMGTLRYCPSTSSLADIPVAPYPIGSLLATLAPSSSSSELRPEFVTGPKKDVFSTSSGSMGPIFSKVGPAPHPQLSGQKSVRSNSSSTGEFPSSS